MLIVVGFVDFAVKRQALTLKMTIFEETGAIIVRFSPCFTPGLAELTIVVCAPLSRLLPPLDFRRRLVASATTTTVRLSPFLRLAPPSANPATFGTFRLHLDPGFGT